MSAEFRASETPTDRRSAAPVRARVQATMAAMDVLCRQQHPEHLRQVAEQWEDALEITGFDAVVVAAGRPKCYQFDDLTPFFRPNPHFALWYPDRQCEGAALLIAPSQPPALFFHSPADYWHQPAQAPDWAREHFNLRIFETDEALEAAVAEALRTHRRVAFIGEEPPERWAVESQPCTAGSTTSTTSEPARPVLKSLA